LSQSRISVKDASSLKAIYILEDTTQDYDLPVDTARLSLSSAINNYKIILQLNLNLLEKPTFNFLKALNDHGLLALGVIRHKP